MLALRRSFAFILTLGLLSAVSTGQAAKVKVWQQQLQSHFDKAHFKQAIVTSEGTLRLSRQAKMLANLEAAHIWDMVEDKDGNLYVATGDEGKLWRVAPDGKASVVHTAADSQLLCLAQGRGGAGYAGPRPGGRV